MKVGDLVKRSPGHDTVQDYGIGLIVSKLEVNPFIDYSSDEQIEKRWAVLWTNPLWTMAVSYTHLTLPTTPYV